MVLPGVKRTIIVQMDYREPRGATLPLRDMDICEVELEAFYKIEVSVGL